MSKTTPNIKAQDIKGLKEFVEEIVQKEIELKVEEIVKNYLEKRILVLLFISLILGCSFLSTQALWDFVKKV